MGLKEKKSLQVVTGKKNEQETLPKCLKKTTEQVDRISNKINWLDDCGMGLLHWACRKNSLEEVQSLIEAGIDIDLRDKNGVLPLQWCLALKHFDIACFLLELGSEIPFGLDISQLQDRRKKYLHQNRDALRQQIENAAKSKLESLAVSFRFFDKLPEQFSTLNSLTSVSLRYNSLTDFPPELFSLEESLIDLDLSHNLLESIPPEWSRLTLQSFNCSHNFIREFPEIHNVQAMNSLDISHNLLDALPKEISQFCRLLKFNCSHNFIKIVPKNIVKISCLDYLNFSHNQIRVLRDIPIHLMYALVNLDLSYNQLTEVPYEDILTSPTIRKFGFKHNQLPLEYFRILKCYYSRLESLDLSGLYLSTLPDQLRLLTHLRELNLRNNNFTVLPNQVGHLSELTSLDLSYNRIVDLPLFIRKLSKLQNLNLEETKSFISNPPKGVIERGLRSIMGHYEDLLQGDPCFRLKLMFVGQENVGKSTLLHALMSHKLRRKTKRGNISTDGIDIERWQIKTSTKQNLTFSAWDFAGQEIYYATHSLFLSTKAIYLIVWDLRYSDTDARVEFWLNSVASRAVGAPVVLVGTHYDDPMFRDNPEKVNQILKDMSNKYTTRFKNIKRICALSASTSEGVPELMEILKDLALSMPNIRIPLPKIYQSLEDLVFERKEHQSPPALDWVQFSELASQVRFKDEEQLLRATNFLNDLGSLVFFEDDSTGGHDRLIVLDPQWLTAMFASVITTSHTYIKNGILRTSNLHQIWRPPQYPPQMHSQLLAILKKFEIIYPLPMLESAPTSGENFDGNSDGISPRTPGSSILPRPGSSIHSFSQSQLNQNGSSSGSIILGGVGSSNGSTTTGSSGGIVVEQCFLVPNLLPVESPPINLLWLEWDPNVIEFARQYTLEFIPNGLFSKFMVRFLHFTDNPLKYWRTGVLAERKGDKALIEMIERTIFVTVRGPTSAELLRIATEILDTLVNTWFKVSVVQARVPCPHCLGYRASQPYLFDLQECEQAAARNNARVVKCPVDQSHVRLDRMVPDLAMTDFQGSQVDFQEIQIEKLLGKGSFGEVFRATWKGESVAVKMLKVVDDDDIPISVEAFSEFRREVWLMSGLEHPCIVNLKAYSLSPLSMVLECVSGGDLFQLIHNESIHLDWQLRLKLALDVAHGMKFLHGISPALLHRDLKSPNILVMSLDDSSNNNSTTSVVLAKVADFGLSSRMFVDERTDRAVENPTWCAPEVLQQKPYTEKADVYSYGVILWELLTRELPFDNYKFQHQVEDDVIKGVRPSIPEDCWEEYADLIRVCWAPDPNRRPGFDFVIDSLFSMIQAHIGTKNFRYSMDPLSKRSVSGSGIDQNQNRGSGISMNQQQQQQQSQPSQSSGLSSRKTSNSSSEISFDSAHPPSLLSRGRTNTSLHGSLTKKLESGGKEGISCLLAISNQVWCSSFDGSINVFSAESGHHLVTYKAIQSKINSLQYVNERVWSASNGDIGVWTVEDLVTEDAYEVKIRSGFLQSKNPSDKKRFTTSKYALRFCILYRNGYMKLFKSQGDPNPVQEIFLTESKVTLLGKNFRFSVSDSNQREIIFQAKTEEELHGWVFDLNMTISRFSDVPLAQETLRKLNSDGTAITSMLRINDNHIFVGCEGVIRLTDHRIRVKNTISLHNEIPDTYHLGVNCLVDSGTHIWASVSNHIVRFNCVTCKIVNVLECHHKSNINALVRVDEEIWSAGSDALLSWNAVTGEFVSIVSQKPKTGWHSLLNTGDTVWAGTSNGTIYLFDVEQKLEKSTLKQHKTQVTSLVSVLGGLIWSGSLDNEICIWK